MGLILSTFCGVTIPYPAMGRFWRVWLYQLNPWTRTISSMIATELHGLVITCKPDEFAVFPPPVGQTCRQWAEPFISAFGGYLDNPDATDACRYCQYSVGDQFYAPLNIDYDKRWRDVWILFCYFSTSLSFSLVVYNADNPDL